MTVKAEFKKNEMFGMAVGYEEESQEPHEALGRLGRPWAESRFCILLCVLSWAVTFEFSFLIYETEIIPAS